MIKVGVAVGTAVVGVGVGRGPVLTQPERTKDVTRIEVATLAAIEGDCKVEIGWGHLLRELWEGT